MAGEGVRGMVIPAGDVDITADIRAVGAIREAGVIPAAGRTRDTAEGITARR
jgi:hypothetical protein